MPNKRTFFSDICGCAYVRILTYSPIYRENVRTYQQSHPQRERTYVPIQRERTYVHIVPPTERTGRIFRSYTYIHMCTYTHIGVCKYAYLYKYLEITCGLNCRIRLFLQCIRICIYVCIYTCLYI
jgi:hypothetical protein